MWGSLITTRGWRNELQDEDEVNDISCVRVQWCSGACSCCERISTIHSPQCWLQAHTSWYNNGKWDMALGLLVSQSKITVLNMFSGSLFVVRTSESLSFTTTHQANDDHFSQEKSRSRLLLTPRNLLVSYFRPRQLLNIILILGLNTKMCLFIFNTNLFRI